MRTINLSQYLSISVYTDIFISNYLCLLPLYSLPYDTFLYLSFPLYIFYLYLCISISIYAYLYLSMHTYIYLCISISLYAYLYLSMHIYIYLCISISIYAYLYLSTHIYIYLIQQIRSIPISKSTRMRCICRERSYHLLPGMSCVSIDLQTRSSSSLSSFGKSAVTQTCPHYRVRGSFSHARPNQQADHSIMCTRE